MLNRISFAPTTARRIPCGLALALLLMGGGSCMAHGDIEGVNVPEAVSVEGQALRLNGAGLREISLLGARVKLYVASLYTPVRVRGLEDLLACPRPVEINFTFLKGVSRTLVERSWRQQFARSATYTYPWFDKDQETFISLLGNLDEKGRDTVQFFSGETRVLDQGRLMGTIRGEEFQRAFFYLLFGDKPISRRLKASLLGVSSVPR
jgi:Chalcone isomerase-like